MGVAPTSDLDQRARARPRGPIRIVEITLPLVLMGHETPQASLKAAL